MTDPIEVLINRIVRLEIQYLDMQSTINQLTEERDKLQQELNGRFMDRTDGGPYPKGDDFMDHKVEMGSKPEWIPSVTPIKKDDNEELDLTE